MSTKKKVLILSQYFDPEPVLKNLSFAKALIKRGFKVEVLTGFPNYPIGKIYDGYNLKLFDKRIIDEVTLHRVFLYPSHNKNSLLRLINYLSFSLSTMLYGLFKLERPDIIYAYHPPLTVGISAIILKNYFKAPLVYDIQDLWPDTLKASGIVSNVLVLNFIGLISKLIYKFSDKLVVLSPGFKNLLIKRGVNSNKIKIIYNWSLIKRNKKCENRIKLSDKRDFIIMFAGNIGISQSLSTLIKAAEILLNNKSKAKFVIIGDGVELNHLKTQVKIKKLTNFVFYKRVSNEEISDYLEKANAFIVHLKDKDLFKITIPSKTQTYMKFEKPIIMAVKGDAEEIIKDSKSGLICEPENHREIAKTIEQLMSLEKSKLKVMGENASRYYEKNFSFEKGVDDFTVIFNSLIK